MKNFITGFCLVFAFVISVEACPYQKMAEVDSQLFTKSNKIDTDTLNKITNLKIKSQEKLKIGELDNAEKILDRALALISN